MRKRIVVMALIRLRANGSRSSNPVACRSQFVQLILHELVERSDAEVEAVARVAEVARVAKVARVALMVSHLTASPTSHHLTI